MFTRLASALALSLALAGPAAAQQGVPFFPQTIPSGTVIGRLSSGPGPTETIPMAALLSALFPPGTAANSFNVASLGFAGSISGQITLRSASSTGTFTIVLPSAIGLSNSCMVSQVSGSVSSLSYVPCALLGSNNTYTGVNTFTAGALFSGVANFTSTFQVGGNNITFPAAAATLAYLAGSQTYTGNNTFSGTTALSGGGSMAGTFTGSPTFTGALTFSGGGALSGTFTGAPTLSGAVNFSGNPAFGGVPTFTGLSSGTCAKAIGLNASNQSISIACPGASSSIQIGTTSVTTASGSSQLLTTGTVTAGTGTLANVTFSSLASSLVSAQAIGGNPTGTGATVMMGLGSSCTITPAVTGRVAVSFNFTHSNTAGTTDTAQLKFGTGAAPANNTGTTGTSIGSQRPMFEPTATASNPVSVSGLNVTGLTPGTAYWFDILLGAGAGIATVSAVDCSLREY